jgi:hypothetical protein
MNEFNTKITYFKDGQINIKKTIKAYSKFYLAYYAKIIVTTIKQRINDETYKGLYNQAN